MAFCRNCGHKLADDAKFCDGCGVRVGEVAKQEERKFFHDGEVHKCPQCGEVLNSFTGNCPSCGYELRGVKAVSSVQRLADKLEEIESKRSKQNWTSFAQQFIKGKHLSPVDEEKINLIQTFPIPTAKEDIREFLTLAEANMNIVPFGSRKEQEAQQAIASAWRNKYNQANKKAKLLFKDTSEYQELGITESKKGWRSWHPLGQVFWVFINIYLLGIPALIYVCCRKK